MSSKEDTLSLFEDSSAGRFERQQALETAPTIIVIRPAPIVSIPERDVGRHRSIVLRPGDAVLMKSGAADRQSSVVCRPAHDVAGGHAPALAPPRMVTQLELPVLFRVIDVIIGNPIASGRAVS